MRGGSACPRNENAGRFASAGVSLLSFAEDDSMRGRSSLLALRRSAAVQMESRDRCSFFRQVGLQVFYAGNQIFAAMEVPRLPPIGGVLTKVLTGANTLSIIEHLRALRSRPCILGDRCLQEPQLLVQR